MRYISQREIWRFLTFSLVDKSAQKYDVNFVSIVEYVQKLTGTSLVKLKPLLLLALAISSVEARSSLLNLASFGGTSSYAASVNEHGSVTGAIKFSSNETRAFVLSKNGSIRFLDDLGGNLTQGWGINDQDTVVGMGKDNFLYVRAIKATTGGATENLGSLDRFGAIAFAINESGLIVGASVGLRQNQNQWQREK